MEKIKQFFSSSDGKSAAKPDGIYPPVLPRGQRADLEAQIRGTIYGNCIGDAIGLLTEFMSKQHADQAYYKMYYEDKKLEYADKLEDFHRSRWKTGDWTDDSDQMILIMDSIVDCQGEVKATDFALKLLNWARFGFKELGDFAGMGIGSTTHNVLKHAQYKTDPHAAAMDIWTKTGCVVAPNGGVMRTSILGIYQYQDLEKVVENSKVVSKVTHADPRCVASCIAVCSTIAFMLRKDAKHMRPDGSYDIEAIITNSYKIAKADLANAKNGKAFCKELKHHMFATNLKDLHLDDKNKIGYTFKAMGSGFWALRQDDFRTALQSLIMEGGDADTNGAVAGAMLGCKLYDKLPDSWLSGLKHKDWLDKRIDRFLDLMFNDEGNHGNTDPQAAKPENTREVPPESTEESASSESRTSGLQDKDSDKGAQGSEQTVIGTEQSGEEQGDP